MTSYLLAYDKTNEEDSSDYDKLWEELEAWGGQRTQYSLWLVEDNSTAKEVLAHFRNFVDADDRLLVSELVENHGYKKGMTGTKKWIKENPPQR